jgi:hypothetical protein
MDSRIFSSHGPNTSTTQYIGAFLNTSGSFGNELVFSGGTRGTFEFGTTIDTLVTDIAGGDFDGDGKTDIANRAYDYKFGGGHAGGNPFAINLGDGAGNFTVLPMADPGPLGAAADLNGDQLTDFIVLDAANNSIAVLVNATPAFSMIPASTTLTASSGQQVTDVLTFATANSFSSTIQLSCQVTGPAPAPTRSLSSANINAGAGSSTSTLTISVPGASVGLLPLQPLYALALPFAFVGLGFRRKSVNPRHKRWLLGISLATTAMLCTACGGGGGNSNTQSVHHAKSYTVQVTAASDTLTKTTQISMNMQ